MGCDNRGDACLSCGAGYGGHHADCARHPYGGQAMSADTPETVAPDERRVTHRELLLSDFKRFQSKGGYDLMLSLVDAWAAYMDQQESKVASLQAENAELRRERDRLRAANAAGEKMGWTGEQDMHRLADRAERAEAALRRHHPGGGACVCGWPTEDKR